MAPICTIHTPLSCYSIVLCENGGDSPVDSRLSHTHTAILCLHCPIIGTVLWTPISVPYTHTAILCVRDIPLSYVRMVGTVLWTPVCPIHTPLSYVSVLCENGGDSPVDSHDYYTPPLSYVSGLSHVVAVLIAVKTGQIQSQKNS